MSVILLLLKILGGILLALLCLILLVLLLILLVPLRYSFYFQYEQKKLLVGGKLSWFLKILRLFLHYKEKVFTYSFKIFSKTLFSNEEDFLKEKEEKRKRKAEKKKKKEENQSQSSTVDLPDLAEPEPEPDHVAEEKPEPEMTEPVEEPETGMAEAVEKPEPEVTVTYVSSQEDKPKKKKKKKEETSPEQSGTDKVREWKDKIQALPLEDLFREGKRLIVCLLKHICPREISGYLIYGFEDPAMTGQVTGLIAALYPAYGRSFRPQPDFTQKILEGDLRGSGRIRLGYLLFIVVRVLFVKEIRKLLWQLWKKH